MGRAEENTPSFLELDDTVMTKPKEIFIRKTEKLQKHMKNSESNTNISKQLIKGYLVKNKDCVFDFQSI